MAIKYFFLFPGFQWILLFSRICPFQDMSILEYVFLGYVHSRICRSTVFCILGYVRHRICLFQDMFCLGSALSRNCLFQNMSVVGYVLSRICPLQDMPFQDIYLQDVSFQDLSLQFPPCTNVSLYKYKNQRSKISFQRMEALKMAESASTLNVFQRFKNRGATLQLSDTHNWWGRELQDRLATIRLSFINFSFHVAELQHQTDMNISCRKQIIIQPHFKFTVIKNIYHGDLFPSAKERVKRRVKDRKE